MYDRLPGLVLGFHGCDRSVAERVIARKSELKQSKNTYDWLGNGIYFWENNVQRALEWAKWLEANPRTGRPKVRHPAVIGAVLDLGFCLNLLDAQFLSLLPVAYAHLAEAKSVAGEPMPTNRAIGDSSELLLRDLDCAVIQVLHQSREDAKEAAFDTVRGVFVEGEPVYLGAAIKKLNHIQICVRNPDCIKGYFWPR